MAAFLIFAFGLDPILVNAESITAVGALPRKKTLVSALAPLNASLPIDVTPAGIVMEVSALAPLNVKSLIDVTPVGMFIAVSALAFWNA